MTLVPDDFAVPAGLEHERFRLRMLSIDDVVKDFDALCDRVDARGEPRPPFVETVRENLVDLGWHEKEFRTRRSFAYTMVAPDESQVLGCVYVDPSDTHDARVWMWVRPAHGMTASTRCSSRPSASGSQATGRSRPWTGGSAPSPRTRRTRSRAAPP